MNPQVLIWARKTIGKERWEAAERLNVDEQIVKELEEGERKPTIGQLETLTDLYKRPYASFFLPKPPKEFKPPRDHRTFPKGVEPPSFSAETILAIRRARWLQILAKELTSTLGREIKTQMGKANLSENPEVVAIRERERIGVDIHTQSRWRDKRTAFNGWREILENQGVLIFQGSMPLEDTRGFSLTEAGPPVIVLNSTDDYHPRIFSLFHEYAHLLLDKSGICDMNPNNRTTEEIFCNHFAGAFLVPKDYLLHHEVVESHGYSLEWEESDIRKLSSSFKVSREAIVRRLLILGLTTEEFYRMKRGQYIREWEENKRKKQIEQEKKKEAGEEIGWGLPRPIKCFSEHGVPFVSFVLEAHGRGKITSIDAADYLGVRLNHLSGIKELLRARV